MFKKVSLLVAALVLSAPTFAHAEISWTQVDCGAINETLQISRSYAVGTRSLNYAEFITLILSNKAAYDLPKGRPMPSNLWIDADIQSVDPITIPGSDSAFLVTITSKNHVPETRVVCTFADRHEK